MSAEIEQLRNQIPLVKARLQELDVEMLSLRDQHAIKESEQVDLISQGEDATRVEAEIIALRVKQAGTQAAIEKMLVERDRKEQELWELDRASSLAVLEAELPVLGAKWQALAKMLLDFREACA